MFTRISSHILPRGAVVAALAIVLGLPATGALAKSPSLAQIACMARDSPNLRGSRATLSTLCALRRGAPNAARGRNNTAQVQQNGANNSAEIHQRGSGHSANLVQDGDNNHQTILQFGRGTQADIHQTGGQSGVLIQFGW
ncbi:MAG: hypothetical protein EA338_04840 [Roseinatronobacter sp.]|nr:MAG: hypothetical protein EA338_04840 [Roseinatronobacter sp.]